MKVKPVDENDLPDWAQSILSCLYGGSHHWPNVYPWGYGFKFQHFGGLATWDFNDLTRLVVRCHKLGVRASISSGGPRSVSVCIWKRDLVDDKITDTVKEHPSLRLVS